MANATPIHFENVAEAFSRKALVYDDFEQDHPNVARMRRQVRQHVLGFLKPGDRILELNAGTGSDAAFFARQGFRVHATDIAPGMLARIQQKIEQHDLRERLTVQPCSFTEPERIIGGPYDCIFSNFGGLNCIQDLRVVTRGMPRLLRPGGIVTWVVMPPICLWEFAAIFKGDLRTATRRLSRKGTLANVEGVRFMTYYFAPHQVAAAFDDDFEIVRVQGVSVLTPPADHKTFSTRFPRLYRLLVWLDDKVTDARPFRGWGDFFIITMRYAPQEPS